MTGAFLVGASVILFLIGMMYLLDFRAQKKLWKRKVTTWFTATGKRKSAIVLLGDRFDQSKYAKKMEAKLRKANIGLTPSEFYGMLIVGAMALTLVIANVLGSSLLLSLVIAGALLWVMQIILFSLRKNKYQDQLNQQLAEICRMLSNATRSGMTIQQGIDLVAREMNYPASEEFARVSQEMRLGVDFDRALIKLQDRVDSRDFKLFIATLQIQKRAGGNLSEVLEEMSMTLEERKILQQTIKTMTAEQKYIAWILPLMPIFIVFVMNTIVDGFLEPIFTLVGGILVTIFLVCTIATFFLIRKVTDIRV
ncbi:type II secretion system F family protein [Paenalkalicoccus suaedae]|uniref:Type II secretion system F family protein n=1 Tax=Paenalkalicoccus suaedae TaxID=2592382 RepID=A0A859FGJ1_9BACI|nr:type II secretion system F family protein [Paenalkalicoccus suaedae]QKS72483.1 type II secretion system F family protein [Paenalkalicoccus suaedae]